MLSVSEEKMEMTGDGEAPPVVVGFRVQRTGQGEVVTPTVQLFSQRLRLTSLCSVSSSSHLESSHHCPGPTQQIQDNIPTFISADRQPGFYLQPCAPFPESNSSRLWALGYGHVSLGGGGQASYCLPWGAASRDPTGSVLRPQPHGTVSGTKCTPQATLEKTD